MFVPNWLIFRDVEKVMFVTLPPLPCQHAINFLNIASEFIGLRWSMEDVKWFFFPLKQNLEENLSNQDGSAWKHFATFFHFKLADGGGTILHALATSSATWCYVVPELKLYTHRLFNSIHVVRKDLLGAAKFIISNSVLKWTECEERNGLMEGSTD